MMIVPTLRQLEYLVAIADHGTFQAASQACAVTQPGLSAQIQQLESTLGVTLFERARPRALATPAGETLIERARALLVGAEDLVESARVFAKPFTGKLRLGAIPTVGPYLLPHAIPKIRAAHPELRLLIDEDQTANLLAKLNRGELDLVVLALEAPLGDVAQRILFDDPFSLAVPEGHRLARRRSVGESDVEDEAVLLLDEGHCLRDQVLGLCQTSGATELGDFRAASLGTLAQMVASGVGITLLPSLSLPIEGQTTGLRLVPFKKPAPARTIGFAWRTTSPRKDEFEALAKYFRPRGRSRRRPSARTSAP
jgi:LysR family hydrogen peroxide-inducible transcriptional activator